MNLKIAVAYNEAEDRTFCGIYDADAEDGDAGVFPSLAEILPRLSGVDIFTPMVYDTCDIETAMTGIDARVCDCLWRNRGEIPNGEVVFVPPAV